MRHRLKHLTVGQWILVGTFALAACLTVTFGARAIVSAVYWAQHRDEPIEPWMTIGYVAHSHRVSPTVLAEAIGLAPDARDRRPIAEIAAERGVPAADLAGRMAEAIRLQRQADLPPPDGRPEP